MRWHITWYEGLGCFKNSGKEKSGDDFSGKKSEKKSGKRFSGKGVGVAVYSHILIFLYSSTLIFLYS